MNQDGDDDGEHVYGWTSEPPRSIGEVPKFNPAKHLPFRLIPTSGRLSGEIEEP